MRTRISNTLKKSILKKSSKVSDLLLEESPVVMTGLERTAMTISCRDCDSIPKVKNAGQIIQDHNEELQVMHNGIKVLRGCYHGDWMENIITELSGHHEPQEEKAFSEVLKRLNSGATMIELGSFWAYYSLWFNKAIKNANNYCFEPDPTNLSFGKKNAKINDCKMHFEEAAAGSQHNSIITLPLDSDPSVLTRVKIVSVDGFAKRTNIQKIDLLHMDVQGVELDALVGASESIKKGMVRFIIVSTHHYMFSGDPMTHKKCMDFIESHGGTIIASHTILESFSGDGLIVASFDAKDTNMAIDMSYNHTDKALFRSYEDDLGRIFNANVKN